MVEHLDRIEVKLFLREAPRVLAPGGIIRIGVPDLRKMVDQYNMEENADAFVEQTLLTSLRPKRFLERLKHVLIGPRHHLWMYDGLSLCRLLSSQGFRDSRIITPPNLTLIPDPGELNLHERADESVYVEATK